MALGTTGDNAQVEGWPALREFLDWGARRLPLDFARGLERGAIYLEGKLRENLSGKILNRRTSTLVRTVSHEARDLGMTQAIGATTFYLAVHEGEAAGAGGGFVTIKPKTKKALRFEYPWRSGEWHTVQEVKIPIRRPVGVTYEEHGEAAYGEVEATIRKAFESIR